MATSQNKPQNIIEDLRATFDRFDEEEPMCGEAREVFRNEIVPQTKALMQRLLDKGDLDAARAMTELIGLHLHFVELNGPASGVSDPDADDGLLQRTDLDEDGQRWRS